MGDQTGPAKGWLVDAARTGTEVSIVVFIGVFFFFGLLGSPFRFTKTFTIPGRHLAPLPFVLCALYFVLCGWMAAWGGD
jgi:hypothetical protein